MSIFDVFTFKKQAQGVFTTANVKEVLGTAKEAIISQVKAKIPGQEKKEAVDLIVTTLVQNKTKGVTNGLLLWVISLILKAVPTITQLVYDFLKQKVENL